MRQRLLFYNSIFRSVLHYVSSIWTSCDKENLGHVLKLQKQAARVISDADNQASSIKLFNRLQLNAALRTNVSRVKYPYILKIL